MCTLAQISWKAARLRKFNHIHVYLKHIPTKCDTASQVWPVCLIDIVCMRENLHAHGHTPTVGVVLYFGNTRQRVWGYVQCEYE